MKLLLALMLFPAVAFGQTIPKKANVILVQSVTFKEVVDTLLDHGYFFQQVDTINHTIITQPRTFKNGNYFMQIYVKDSVVTITGKFNMNGEIKLFGVTYDAKEYEDIRNAAKGSVYGNAFLKLDQFALRFNKPVTYQVR